MTALAEPETKTMTTLTLTRPQFIEVIENVLGTMGVHLEEYEREKLREFAHNATKVSFGIWDLKPGCPLEQTGLCPSYRRADSVFELFTTHFDRVMRKQWGLDPHSLGTVTVL